MNAERLLLHYEKIADAPDAIPRLRRFILDLAVRGKLVPQDPNNEPAYELLKRIARERARLVGAREIRKPPTLEPIGDIETLHALPRTWAWVRVGDIFDYDAGAKRDPTELDQERWLLELEDIEKDTSRIVERLRVGDRASQSTKSEFEIDDILYGKLRPYLNKVVIADEPGYSTTEIVAIRPFLKLCPEYCALAFRRPDFVSYVERLGRGTKMPRLRTPDAIVAPFPLPPLAEQRCIVAKVDELMALCDRLEAVQGSREAVRDRLAATSFARLSTPDPETFHGDVRFALEALPALTTRPDQIKQLRQTILNLAVCGTLVQQDPKDEPASELLKRIANDKARLVKAGEVKNAEVVSDLTASVYDFPRPCGWAITNLLSICNSVTDGDHLPPPKSETGIPFLVIGNVRSQRIEFDGSRFVPQSYYDALDAIRRPRSGDLLYTLVGSFGIPVVVRDDRPFCVQRHIGILRPSTLVNVNFLARVLESRLAFDQATACATGIAQKTVPLSGLRRLLLPLPPLAEQHRIVTKVDELMALCDRLEKSLASAADIRRCLLDALLSEALEPSVMQEEAA